MHAQRVAHDVEQRGRAESICSPPRVVILLDNGVIPPFYRQGRLTFNPVTPMRLQREHNARNRCLNVDEEARLMAALPARLRTLVTVAMHTGMRQGELRALRWADVDFETAAIRIARDKAGDGRWVAMNTVTREALAAAKREARVLGPYVFASAEGKFLHNFERYWRPAVTAASIPDFRFHDLRHTFASRLAMRVWTSIPCSGRAAGRRRRWFSGTRTSVRTICEPPCRSSRTRLFRSEPAPKPARARSA